MKNLNIDEERILYLVKDKGEISTPEISEHYAQIDRRSISYKLDKMQNMGLVSVRKEQEIGGSAKPTNYYRANISKIRKYEVENGELFEPRYIFVDKIENLENRINQLEQDNKSLRNDFETWKEYVKKFNSEVEDRLSQMRRTINLLDD